VCLLSHFLYSSFLLLLSISSFTSVICRLFTTISVIQIPQLWCGGAQILQISRRHLKMLSVIMVTRESSVLKTEIWGIAVQNLFGRTKCSPDFVQPWFGSHHEVYYKAFAGNDWGK
jgi:hypothetical protein